MKNILLIFVLFFFVSNIKSQDYDLIIEFNPIPWLAKYVSTGSEGKLNLESHPEYKFKVKNFIIYKKNIVAKINFNKKDSGRQLASLVLRNIDRDIVNLI